MGAPKGNQFWKLRSKHGRDKLFATPELLWSAACEYFQWCDENPWLKMEQSRGTPKPIIDDLTGEKVWPDNITAIPVERPYTVHGLCLYLDCNTQYFNDFAKNLKENEKDFSIVVTRIMETIYKQKFEGAAVGTFNSNIIARDLGLTDKKDLNLGGKVETDFSKISTDELLKRAEAIKKLSE